MLQRSGAEAGAGASSETLPARSGRFFRSASLRLAALYALIFGVSALALVGFIWWETAGLVQRQVQVAIEADTQGLSERYQEGGLGALAATIRDRLRENVDDDAIYLLTDAEGNRIEGNLERWPEQVTHTDTFYTVSVERAGQRSVALLHAFNLLGGFHVLVGRDVRSRAQLNRLLTDALFWALFVVVALGAVGAAVIRSLLLRMLGNVSATAEAIAAGDLTKRVRLTGRGDEFDRLAETINDMLDRIARLMDGVRQVSNAIAHDLRTPIARARARLEDAGAHARTEEDLRAAIERATADLDGVASVFAALLRIAEIEAGARRSAFAMFDLATLLADIGELYGAVAEERGIRLQMSVSQPLSLYGDRDLIQQAVANLIDNALKFSPPEGTVELSAGPAGKVMEIAVADHGPGIPEADRARATERFFRGETARHTPGAGLGLALVQAVAALHNGELRLEDAEPGLRAVIAVPAQPES